MEEDRIQTDLGIAADIEEAQIYEAFTSLGHQTSASAATRPSGSAPEEATPQAPQDGAMKQPKKRFVGRRAAAEAAAAKGDSGQGDGESGAVQREFLTFSLNPFSKTSFHILQALSL